MITPFSLENQAFTDDAHAAARSMIYPEMFGVRPSHISWKDCHVGGDIEGAVLDATFAVDRIAAVTRPGSIAPIETMIQERFRRITFASYRDLTITELNTLTGHRSEFFKIKAGRFVYGYWDNVSRQFGEVIAANTEILIDAIVSDRIKVSRGKNPRSGQTFLKVPFDAMNEIPGLVMWHKKDSSQTSRIMASRRYVSGRAASVQSTLCFFD